MGAGGCWPLVVCKVRAPIVDKERLEMDVFFRKFLLFIVER